MTVESAEPGHIPTQPAEEPRSARREATRERILDAARVVFAEKGVFGASIEDICDQARFTRGAVYSNFADKDDLLRAVIEREQRTLLDRITGSLDIVDSEAAAASSLDVAARAIVNRILRSLPIERHFILIATELELHAARRPESAAAITSGNRLFRARLAEAIAEAMGRIEREPAVAPLQIADAVLAIGERSFRLAMIDGENDDPYQLAESVLPALLVALSRPRSAAPA